MAIRTTAYILSSILIPLVIGCSTVKSDFEKTRRIDSVRAYDLFLKFHPNSEYSDEARRCKEELLRIQTEKDRRIRSLKKGVSKESVRSLLGTPDKYSMNLSQSTTCYHDGKQTTEPMRRIDIWVYKLSDKDYTLNFENDALIKILVDSTAIPFAD